MFRGIDVKFISMKGSYISLKYTASNATTRVKKDQFINDYAKGVYNVVNVDDLPEELAKVKEEAED